MTDHFFVLALYQPIDSGFEAVDAARATGVAGIRWSRARAYQILKLFDRCHRRGEYLHNQEISLAQVSFELNDAAELQLYPHTTEVRMLITAYSSPGDRHGLARFPSDVDPSPLGNPLTDREFLASLVFQPADDIINYQISFMDESCYITSSTTNISREWLVDLLRGEV